RADRKVGGPARAARELEGRDPRVPVEAAVRGEILIRVPERAFVAGIDAHARVVAPAAETTVLRAVGRDDRPFSLRHLPEWIAGEPAGVPDPRMQRRARGAVAERHVAVSIPRDAAHPAV